MNPLVTRQLESAVTFFVATFLMLGGASVANVDVSNTHAVIVAVGMAASGAVMATVKHVFPFLTTLQVKGKA